MPSSGLRNIGTRQNSGHVNATKKGAGGGSSTPGFHVSFTHNSTSWHTYASNVIIPWLKDISGSLVYVSLIASLGGVLISWFD